MVSGITELSTRRALAFFSPEGHQSSYCISPVIGGRSIMSTWYTNQISKITFIPRSVNFESEEILFCNLLSPTEYFWKFNVIIIQFQ